MRRQFSDMACRKLTKQHDARLAAAFKLAESLFVLGERNAQTRRSQLPGGESESDGGGESAHQFRDSTEEVLGVHQDSCMDNWSVPWRSFNQAGKTPQVGRRERCAIFRAANRVGAIRRFRAPSSARRKLWRRRETVDQERWLRAPV